MSPRRARSARPPGTSTNRPSRAARGPSASEERSAAASARRVRAPKRLLSAEIEESLTPRQLEILDLLEESVHEMSLADFSMAETAKLANCSLRTLYEIAPSKDELTQIVVDRRLHRIGREAIRALEREGTPLERLRAYLEATNHAVQPTTAAFSREFARKPAARRLVESHATYIVAVTQALLDEAVDVGEIPAMDTGALAHVLGGLGAEFSRSQAEASIAGSPKEAADFVASLIFAGLERASTKKR